MSVRSNSMECQNYVMVIGSNIGDKAVGRV